VKRTNFFHRKSIDAIVDELSHGESAQLSRRLGWPQLMMMGIGAIVGGGIFVITGTAAAQFAGPAIILSFVLAAVGCALVGLCYAELAATIPAAGGGYTYVYATLGEGVAWFVGWSILMEYLCAASYVAVGWSGYVSGLLGALGIHPPPQFMSPALRVGDGGLELAGGILNVPAVLVSLIAMAVARRGIGLSANVNAVLVAMKVGVLLLFLLCAGRYVSAANWAPFLPANHGEFGHFGWSGVLRGAAVIFVAYLGFDAISTLAQETREPQRNVPIGILGALVVCTLLYVSVSLVLTGIASYTMLNVANPLSTALRAVGGALDWLAPLVEVVAMSGLASVMLVVLTAQSRICLSMSQDGLLPERYARVHPRYRTPAFSTAASGVVVATLSGLFPVAELSQLVSLGTIGVFVAVCTAVLVLRKTRPELPRPFQVPFGSVIPLLGIAICLYLLFGVPAPAWKLFIVWSAGGVLIYCFYGRAAAARRRAASAPGRAIGSETMPLLQDGSSRAE
jgi:basic amino acid/polyamine antiporter, APA family